MSDRGTVRDNNVLALHSSFQCDASIAGIATEAFVDVLSAFCALL